MTASTNGTAPSADAPVDDSPLARLRQRPENPHGFRGFGPLIALGVLLVLMVLLAPTVAPEEIILQPTDSTTTTVVDAPSSSTTAPTTTAPDGEVAP